MMEILISCSYLSNILINFFFCWEGRGGRLFVIISAFKTPLLVDRYGVQCVTPLLAFFQHTKLLQEKLLKMTTQLLFVITELQKA